LYLFFNRKENYEQRCLIFCRRRIDIRTLLAPKVLTPLEEGDALVRVRRNGARRSLICRLDVCDKT
jgi:hypothetical protein